MAIEHELISCTACSNRGMVDGERCAACNGQGFVRAGAVAADADSEDGDAPAVKAPRRARRRKPSPPA